MLQSSHWPKTDLYFRFYFFSENFRLLWKLFRKKNVSARVWRSCRAPRRIGNVPALCPRCHLCLHIWRLQTWTVLFPQLQHLPAYPHKLLQNTLSDTKPCWIYNSCNKINPLALHSCRKYSSMISKIILTVCFQYSWSSLEWTNWSGLVWWKRDTAPDWYSRWLWKVNSASGRVNVYPT